VRAQFSDYFGAGGGAAAAAMDWSFASRAALMSFRSSSSAAAAAAREETRELAFPHFSALDGAKMQQASHVLARQVACAVLLLLDFVLAHLLLVNFCLILIS
jgi:hypothetical protein